MQKAYPWIVSTDSDITTEVNFSQSLKAEFGMFFIPRPIVTDVILVPANASSPIVVTPSGITRAPANLLAKNASSPIVFRVDGKLNCSIPVI